MSQFTTDLMVKPIDDQNWSLIEGFEYHVGKYPSEEIITVPVDFITDFASVPKMFHWIISPKGKHTKAAVIHDYCYETELYSKFKSDRIFLEAMKVLNVKLWKRIIMFSAVVGFGLGAWNKCRRMKHL